MSTYFFCVDFLEMDGQIESLISYENLAILIQYKCRPRDVIDY